MYKPLLFISSRSGGYDVSWVDKVHKEQRFYSLPELTSFLAQFYGVPAVNPNPNLWLPGNTELLVQKRGRGRPRKVAIEQQLNN